jgi:glycosyltransferase involved in cell wall biosynthesis
MFNESSGPYLTLKQTSEKMVQRGHQVTVVGTGAGGEGQPRGYAGEALAFRRFGPYSLHYAPRLGRWLGQEPVRWDLASIQSVWLHTGHLVAKWCLANKRPFMVTAHGNFNPVALRTSRWKKTLARLTFMRPVLDRVTCYQASTELEYQTLRKYGIRKPICVIGNGMVLPDLAKLALPDAVLPGPLLERRTCLYLGRLHPIKGIERLLRAWSMVRPSSEWQLVIAGGGDAAYRAELARIAARADCRNIHFTGFVSSELKAAWFRRADFLVLPSLSEAFAMAPMEAFAFGTPALLTEGCGFPEAARYGGAVEVPSTDDGVAAGLAQMLELPKDELLAMGARALSFVRDCYGWDRICGQLEEVYDWMCGSSDVPECLRLD